jgi:enamine deaminase RidA (YjgF/YER057c/UK114 family)
MTTAEDRLAALGITLPAPAAPVAAYIPAVETNGLLHLAGQLPLRADGSLVTGRLTADDIARGREAAERCGVMLIAQIKAALGGDLSRVERIVKLGAFVSSAPDFTDQAKVANGASELMVAVFGDAGRHARSAVGVAVLPLDASIEIDAIVAVRAS